VGRAELIQENSGFVSGIRNGLAIQDYCSAVRGGDRALSLYGSPMHSCTPTILWTYIKKKHNIKTPALEAI
jgi:hypothetical protein